MLKAGIRPVASKWRASVMPRRLMPQKLKASDLFLSCGWISLWLLNSTVASAITFSQDFDSGSLNVAATTVVGSTVQLVPRYTWTDPFYADAYRWVYFQASQVQGLTPQFRIDSGDFLGSLTNHRYLYSYDQATWSTFDNATFNGGDYVFGNNQPFSQDSVYVAYGLPYPVERTTSKVNGWRASPFVSPTASARASLVLGQSAGGVDDVGRMVPPQDLYGFHITDPTAVGAKAKILLASGAHSAETTGQFVLEGLVDFLLGDSLVASQLRSKADVYVYPQVNPDGRYGGYYRSNPENPDKDFNRYYDDPAGFTDLTIVTQAMTSDTGGDVDYLLDFHSWWGPWVSNDYVITVPELASSPFIQSLATVEPTLNVESSYGVPGMLRIWGMTPDGLDAEFAFTPEFGFHPDHGESRYQQYGENFARALQSLLGAPQRCDLNADNRCGREDVDLLTAQGNLLTGVAAQDAKYDLDADGDVDTGDLAAWLQEAAIENGLSSPYRLGDADLNGEVDGSDFIIWNGRKFTSSTVWSDGDFNGDGMADGLDFILWNGNKFTASSAVAVPEPGSWLLIGLFVVLWSHCRRAVG